MHQTISECIKRLEVAIHRFRMHRTGTESLKQVQRCITEFPNAVKHLQNLIKKGSHTRTHARTRTHDKQELDNFFSTYFYCLFSFVFLQLRGGKAIIPSRPVSLAYLRMFLACGGGEQQRGKPGAKVRSIKLS